jgi:hypothetical protein
VVVALAVTPEGLPVKSWVFPGNTADVSTVERVRSDLRGWKLNRAIFVADSAMNSQNNREELARACGKYLLATRMASISEVKHEVLGKRGRYNVIRESLHAKEVIIGVSAEGAISSATTPRRPSARKDTGPRSSDSSKRSLPVTPSLRPQPGGPSTYLPPFDSSDT